MGCSSSKDLVERPSKKSTKEAWEAVLARGLALQLDTSFKRNGGYIAAIFSANYAGTLRHFAPLSALHTDDLLLCHILPRFTEEYPEIKARKSGVNVRAQKMALLEIEPVLSLDELKEPLTAGKSIGGVKAELETIDIRELMEDLNEQEDSSNVESLHVNDGPTLITNRPRSTMPFFTKPSHDTLPSTASFTRAFAALMPRSKSLNPPQCSEDVNVFVPASTGAVLMPEQSLCAVLHGVNEVKELSRPSSCKLFHKMHQGDIAFKDGDLLTCRHTSESTSNTEFEPISSGPSWKPHNIQRSLSMKYMLNDNTSEKDEPHFSIVSGVMSQLDNADSKECDEENLAFPRDNLSCESECSSSLSSPATASLKDWLPSDSPPFTLTDSIKSDSSPFTLTDSINNGSDPSIFEAIQASHILLAQQMTAYLLPNTRRVLSKYVGEFEKGSTKALQLSAEANMLSFKGESCRAHTFSMEGMDSSDTVTHKDQCASRSLIGNPRSLHTPVGFGQSCQSNCVHKPNTTGNSSLDL